MLGEGRWISSDWTVNMIKVTLELKLKTRLTFIVLFSNQVNSPFNLPHDQVNSKELENTHHKCTCIELFRPENQNNKYVYVQMMTEYKLGLLLYLSVINAIPAALMHGKQCNMFHKYYHSLHIFSYLLLYC